MLVSLQAEWCGREDELFALGVPDWRGDPLTVAIESVVQRTWPELVSEDRRALTELLERLPRRFASLAECGVPDSLVHGDFAPGNARGREDLPIVLLDWGDCGVGNPLLDMSAFVDRIASDSVAPIKSHWTMRWRQAIPGTEPTRAAEILEPIAAARQAVIYQGFLDGIVSPPSTRTTAPTRQCGCTGPPSWPEDPEAIVARPGPTPCFDGTTSDGARPRPIPRRRGGVTPRSRLAPGGRSSRTQSPCAPALSVPMRTRRAVGHEGLDGELACWPAQTPSATRSPCRR